MSQHDDRDQWRGRKFCCSNTSHLSSSIVTVSLYRGKRYPLVTPRDHHTSSSVGITIIGQWSFDISHWSFSSQLNGYFYMNGTCSFKIEVKQICEMKNERCQMINAQ